MPLPKQHTYTSEDYWNLPDGQRAELIDGKLYNMAPPSRIHQRLVSQFTRVIGQYIADHHGSCQVYPAPFAVNLDADDNDWVEPDISVICDHSKLTDKGCSGAPDLMIEVVSPSSSRMDYIENTGLLIRSASVPSFTASNPEMHRPSSLSANQFLSVFSQISRSV